MAARKFFRGPSSSTEQRRRDSIIDELPPEETEKMGYVWVVKGTLSDEEEKEAAKFGTLPDINSLPVHEISNCTLAREKVHELIVPDSWEEGQLDGTRGTEDFRLYIPSFIRHMHSLFSRPPELIRQEKQGLQEIMEQMPVALPFRQSYLSEPPRFLDRTPRPPAHILELTRSDVESEQEPEEEPEQEQEQEPKQEPQPVPEPQPEPDVTYRYLNAIHADPGIVHVEPEKPPEPERKVPFKLKKVQIDERDRIPSGKEPFVREYIMRKLIDLENKLKSVDNDISGSKERQIHLKYHFYEMEILRLVEKISNDDTPSETDVAKLEYLTDQLKIAQGKKTAEE